MFEAPILDKYPGNGYNGRASLIERKLRYRYINQTHRRYEALRRRKAGPDQLVSREEDRLSKRSADGDDGDDTGSPVHDSKSSEEYSSDFSEDDKDEEKHYFKRYEKPQETYEIWNDNNPEDERVIRKRVPLQTDIVTFNDIRQVEEKSRREVQRRFAHVGKRFLEKFDNMADGYEIIGTNRKVSKRGDQTVIENNDTIDVRFIKVLTDLLYLNVYRQEWSIAYRIFAILVRLPKVDIRSLWVVGIKILSALEAQEHETESTVGDQSFPRSLRFLEWMSKVYSTRGNFIQGRNYKLDPVFRAGSKNHTPKYTLALLWKRLIRSSEAMKRALDDHRASTTWESSTRALEELIERLSELVLRPPFMEDPEVWFIYSMCYLVKADNLSQRILRRRQLAESYNALQTEPQNNEVDESIELLKKCLKTCDEKSRGAFVYPKRMIDREIRDIELRVYGEVDHDVLREEESDDTQLLSLDTQPSYM